MGIYNKKNQTDLIINFTLITATILVLGKFLEIGLTGDDPFIYMDAFRKGGLWKASILQSIGQGRFWLIPAWTLTQVPYLLDNLIITNIIKIITSAALFGSFFMLIKNFFGLSFAYITSFIALMILNIAGGDFCPLINSPLWYSIGGISIIWSFIRFDIELKDKLNHAISSLLFLFGILFYEIFVLYILVFPMILNRHHSDFNKSILYKLNWLGFILIIYALSYIAFTQWFPSQYVNTQKLEIVSIKRSLETIYELSSNGIALFDLHKFKNVTIQSIFFSILTTLTLLTGLIAALKKLSSEKYNNLSTKIYSNKVALALLVISITPNLLYGFLDYYHGWKYYVGTFFSALGLITLISLLLAKLVIKENKGLSIIIYAICLLLSLVSFNNHHTFYNKFENLKSSYLKQSLVKSLAPKIKNVISSSEIICSESLFSNKKDSYEIYDFWSIYLSEKTDKKIKVVHGDHDVKECTSYIAFDFNKGRATLDFNMKDNSFNIKLNKESIF